MREHVDVYTWDEEGLNKDLMYRKNDKPLHEYVINSFKSLCVINNITLVDWELEEDESKISLKPYIHAKRRNVDDPDEAYMMLEDTRFSELRLRFRLTCKDGVETLTKNIQIPKVDRNGYMNIRGKKYFLMYQMVDNSTYTTRRGITLKSLMAVILKKEVGTFKDIEGEAHKIPVYRVSRSGKDVEIMKLYFANFGVFNTLNYFNISSIVDFREYEESGNDKILQFKINSNLYLAVERTMFEKYEYVRSCVGMLVEVCNNRTKIEDLDDRDYWIEKFGSIFTKNKYIAKSRGHKMLIIFRRMIDITTVEVTKTHEENKKDVFAVLRWKIQNYKKLRAKSNIDLNNKRLRLNEYIAAQLNIELGQRIERVINNNKTALENIRDIFKFPSDIIFSNLQASGLLRFDDTVNDMDFFNMLKYTIKGPSSVGGKNDRNIHISQRGVHKSQLGRVDIGVCG